MNLITLENATVIVTGNSASYSHNWVQNVSANDPAENSMERSPQSTGDNIVWKQNTSAASTLGFTARKISANQFKLYKKFFGEQTPLDVLITDKKSNETHSITGAVLKMNPSNVSIAGGAGSTDIKLDMNFDSANWDHDF